MATSSDQGPPVARRSARSLGLRRTRVDAYRVYAMLVVIIGHSELLLGHTADAHVAGFRWVFNVVSRFAVPLFFILAGEHLGPRLLRDQSLAAGRPYAGRLLKMLVVTSLVYWAADLAKLFRRRGFDAFPTFVDRLLVDPLHLLLSGARPHLWFLTVLLVVVLASNLVLARRRVRTLVAGSVAAYALGLTLGPYAPVVGLSMGRMWVEWLLQAPLFFAAGVFFGLERRHPGRYALAVTLIAIGVALHAAEVYWLSTTYDISPARFSMLAGTVPYAIGVALLAFSPGSIRADRWAARYAGVVPLVYLGHMLVLELLLPPRGRFPDLAVRVLLPLLTMVLSFGAAWILRRWLRRARRTRRVLTRPEVGGSSPVPE